MFFWEAQNILKEKNIWGFLQSQLQVTYCNVVWVRPTNIKPDHIMKKKNAESINCNRNKYARSNPLMGDMIVLNVYQIDIFQILKFSPRISGQHSAMQALTPTIKLWGWHFFPTSSMYLPRQFIWLSTSKYFFCRI